MKIKFLGSGSAFVNHEENFQSNILISEGTSNLLYDCGTTINDALLFNSVSLQDITDIYISHLHADHAGGVEFVAFKTYFDGFPFGQHKPRMIAHDDIIKNGWECTWKGGLGAIHGQKMELSNYFDITSHTDNGIFFFEGIEFSPELSTHVNNGENDVPSFGLSWEYNEHSVFISGDCKLPESFTQYETSTIIFHDCEFAEYLGSVHTQFHELKELPDEVKAKMWLYHYALNDKHIWEYETLAEEAGFAGIVRRGQEFNLGLIE
jgi:ribonuclease BN (tRNA processing enzyme)